MVCSIFDITLHDISNIYLYKVAWACLTLWRDLGYATHILIYYMRYIFFKYQSAVIP